MTGSLGSCTTKETPEGMHTYGGENNGAPYGFILASQDAERKEAFVSLFDDFIQRVGLSADHRRHLNQERKLSADFVAGRFATGDPERVQAALRSLVEQGVEQKTLVQARLLEPGKDGGEPRPPDYLINGDVLILYQNLDGEGIALRAHKMQPKGERLELYGLDHIRGKEHALIVEGEFGAAAATCHGIPTLGVPGVAAFVGRNYPRLLKCLTKAGIEQVTILYDLEDRTSYQLPSGEPNPRHKPQPFSRWDVEFNAVRLARRLTADGITTGITQFPEDWMRNGKVDLDQALKDGHTAEEIREVIDAAVLPDEYLESLTDEGKEVVLAKLGENRVKQKDGGLVACRGVLKVVAKPKPRTSKKAVAVFVNERQVLNDTLDLVVAKDRARLVSALKDRIDSLGDVEDLLDMLAEAVVAGPGGRNDDEVCDGQEVIFGGRRAVISPEGICLLEKKDGGTRKIPLANFTLRFIEERVVHDGVEDVHESVTEVEFIGADGEECRKQVVFPSSTLGNGTKFAETLRDQLGARLNIYGDPKVLIAVCIEASRPVVKRVSKVVGWDGQGHYVTPTVIIGPRGPTKLPGVSVSLEGERIASRLGMGWTNEETRDDLARHLLSDFLDQHDRAVTMPVLAHVAAAPIIGMLGDITWPAMHLRGGTGTRKTTIARNAQCFFGDFAGEESIETFQSTVYAIQRTGSLFRDALFVVDDLKRENIRYPNAVVSLIQTYADRTSRGRLIRSGRGHADAYPIRGLMMCTGEDMLDNSASGQARMLVVEVGENRDGLEAGQRCIERAREYPDFLGHYISWLTSMEASTLKSWHQQLSLEFSDELRGTPNAPRVSSNLGVNALGMELMLNFIQDCGVIKMGEWAELRQEHLQILKGLATSTVELVKDQGATDVFIDTLRELLAAGEACLGTTPGSRPDKPGKMIGLKAPDGVAKLFGSQAYALVNDHLRRQGSGLGLGPKALNRDLRARGWVTGEASQVRVEGERPYVWPLKAGLLNIDQGDSVIGRRRLRMISGGRTGENRNEPSPDLEEDGPRPAAG